MDDLEYTEANNNFRHFVSLEREYLQLFVNSTTFLLAAFWLVSTIPALRYMISIVGLFLSAGVLITELRYSTYFKHFFSIAVDIESKNGGKQFSDIAKYFGRPFLGIRSTNVIITFYCVFLVFWFFLILTDLLDANWFETLLVKVSIGKNV